MVLSKALPIHIREYNDLRESRILDYFIQYTKEERIKFPKKIHILFRHPPQDLLKLVGIRVTVCNMIHPKPLLTKYNSIFTRLILTTIDLVIISPTVSLIAFPNNNWSLNSTFFKKTLIETLLPLFMVGVNCLKATEPLRGDDFLPLGSLELLVLTWSNSEGGKTESTLEPPSVFESRTLGLGIPCLNH